MKFLKALQSGRPFRFKGDPNFYTEFEGKIKGPTGEKGINTALLDSDEWELQDKEVKVSVTALSVVLAKYTDAQSAISILKELGA